MKSFVVCLIKSSSSVSSVDVDIIKSHQTVTVNTVISCVSLLLSFFLPPLRLSWRTVQYALKQFSPSFLTKRHSLLTAALTPHGGACPTATPGTYYLAPNGAGCCPSSLQVKTVGILGAACCPCGALCTGFFPDMQNWNENGGKFPAIHISNVAQKNTFVTTGYNTLERIIC